DQAAVARPTAGRAADRGARGIPFHLGTADRPAAVDPRRRWLARMGCVVRTWFERLPVSTYPLRVAVVLESTFHDCGRAIFNSKRNPPTRLMADCALIFSTVTSSTVCPST